MKRTLLAAALAAASLALYAQPYGPGNGPGRGPGYGPGARWGADVTPGWALMTAEERRAHQEKMQSMKDPAECETYMASHHAQMQERAKAKGRALPFKGPGPGCEALKK
jgi:hypothetical protein